MTGCPIGLTGRKDLAMKLRLYFLHVVSSEENAVNLSCEDMTSADLARVIRANMDNGSVLSDIEIEEDD